MPPIDFCHIPVSIIKRSEGRSAVAAAAYRSGTKLTNEWDGLTHDYTRKGGVVHAEIMLPAHAPPEFADRSTLWNSVEQIEKARDSQLAREIEAALPRELSGEQQLALVRAYVKDNFVDKGMCADFAIHDKGTGNPHVHIMLTLRPLKENGQWGAKCRKAYDLDENGQRIPDGKGGWKNHREDTTDWNDKGNVEIWRAAWAAYTNRALEAAGQPALVDHRSYKRQGIDKIPSVHLGPAASQMEKRGIRTDKGEVNRQIAADNKLLKEIKARITRLYNWSKAEAEKPEGQQPSMIDLWEAQQQLKRPDTRTGKIRALQESAALFSFLQANGIQSMQQLHEKIADMNTRYYDLRRGIVKAERRIAVLTERGEMWAQYNEYKAVHKQLAKVKPEKRELTLSDERIEKAITQNGARLIILDPIQAYMGEKTDMNRANEVRPMFRRLADVAERTGCAVILIGHLNKAAGGQSAYRGLGSIDFRAAARSVLLIGRVKREPNVRVIVHDKSSLAPEGKPVAFCLDPETGFSWIGEYDITADELLSGAGGNTATKTEQAEKLILDLLADGKELANEDIVKAAAEAGISERTVQNAKRNMGSILGARRVGGQWYNFIKKKQPPEPAS